MHHALCIMHHVSAHPEAVAHLGYAGHPLCVSRCGGRVGLGMYVRRVRVISEQLMSRDTTARVRAEVPSSFAPPFVGLLVDTVCRVLVHDLLEQGLLGEELIPY
jgi:hypothetical protein